MEPEEIIARARAAQDVAELELSGDTRAAGGEELDATVDESSVELGPAGSRARITTPPPPSWAVSAPSVLDEVSLDREPASPVDSGAFGADIATVAVPVADVAPPPVHDVEVLMSAVPLVPAAPQAVPEPEAQPELVMEVGEAMELGEATEAGDGGAAIEAAPIEPAIEPAIAAPRVASPAPVSSPIAVIPPPPPPTEPPMTAVSDHSDHEEELTLDELDGLDGDLEDLDEPAAPPPRRPDAPPPPP
ncbi:MAG TPA: hypothetical protein VHE35_36695, partial [Kofleriaceae bacterium]|nr:hypothetical protein [Kofleriaceae bacterium]